MALLLRLSIQMRRFFHIEPTALSTRFGIGYIQESPFLHSIYPKTDIYHRNIKFHFLIIFGGFLNVVPLDDSILSDNSRFSASIVTASKSGLTMNFVFLYLNVLIIAAD